MKNLTPHCTLDLKAGLVGSPKVGDPGLAANAASPSQVTGSATDLVDLREQLVNDGEVGSINSVSIPEAMVTRLRAIMIDIDLNLFKEVYARRDRAIFLRDVIGPMLDSHPVLAAAEVRDSGSGLHVLVRLAPHVEFHTDTERVTWAAAVRIVQRLLPCDPHAPGITAMTRPVGSVNGKNGHTVAVLRAGSPVAPDAVLALARQAREAPVRAVGSILFGGVQVSPCPICRAQGSRLGLLDKSGRCYGSCGKIKLGNLYDAFLTARPTAGGH